MLVTVLATIVDTVTYTSGGGTGGYTMVGAGKGMRMRLRGRGLLYQVIDQSAESFHSSMEKWLHAE